MPSISHIFMIVASNSKALINKYDKLNNTWIIKNFDEFLTSNKIDKKLSFKH